MNSAKISCFIAGVLTASVAMAQEPKLVNAVDQIQNLAKTLKQVKSEAKVPVLFPEVVPQSSDKKKYFANRDLTMTQNGYSYWINVDSTAKCNGVKYCNIGNFIARKDAAPEQFVDRDNKPITENVKLAKDTQGYFTPGHAQGDFFPANIQWMTKGVLYSLTWSKDMAKNDEKNSMVAMANSAISAGK